MRALGPWQVSDIGLGCMNFSIPNGPALNDATRADAISAIHAALESGVNFLDSADIYGPSWDEFGYNESFVAEAVASWSGDKSSLVIATKGGITRKPGEVWGRNGSLDYLLRAAEASAGRLGVSKIQLWQHHRLDPSIDFETQFENVLVLKDRGIVEHIGVSNYNAEQLSKAIEISGGEIISVQNQFNPYYRQDLEVLSVAAANDIAYLPWSPFGGSQRAKHPETTRVFEKIAGNHQISAHASILAWLLSIPNCIPIPGASKKATVLDAVTATGVVLSDAELLEISEALAESEDLHHELIDQPSFR